MMHVNKITNPTQWRPRSRRDPHGPDGQIARTLRRLYTETDPQPLPEDFLMLLVDVDAAERERRGT